MRGGKVAIELKQSMKMSQQLVITPQLQQAIKLLQLSRLELTDLISNEVLENPMLEESPEPEAEDNPVEVADNIEAAPDTDKSHEAQPEVGNAEGQLSEPREFEWENYIQNYSDSGKEGRSFVSADETPTYENVAVKGVGLQEHLEWQLRMTPTNEREEELVSLLIGFLDENGYLTTNLEDIAQKNDCTVEDLECALYVLQEFDPSGVGARDLKECLLLQVRRFASAEKAQLETIIKEHLSLLERRDYPTLARKMKLTLEEVLALGKIITDLEPKPGRPFGKSDTQYITPDVYVYKVGEDYSIVLNDEGIPRLRINNFYKSMMSGQANGQSQGEAKNYVQEKLKSAVWLIRSIHQRQRTLYRVTKSIVKFQRDFLDHGIEHLKPMILRDVADEIGVHESTVSRATSNKYVHTPQGIFELKYFFNNGLASRGGEDVASESVKEKIRLLVSQENPRKPLSDKEIVDTLKAASIDIARRTVAKYREGMGILPSSKRRRLY